MSQPDIDTLEGRVFALEDRTKGLPEMREDVAEIKKLLGTAPNPFGATPEEKNGTGMVGELAKIVSARSALMVGAGAGASGVTLLFQVFYGWARSKGWVP